MIWRMAKTGRHETRRSQIYHCLYCYFTDQFSIILNEFSFIHLFGNLDTGSLQIRRRNVGLNDSRFVINGRYGRKARPAVSGPEAFRLLSDSLATVRLHLGQSGCAMLF